MEEGKINNEEFDEIKKKYQECWAAIFMLAGIENMSKPLEEKDLEDENGKAVVTMMKIYSMESFIVYGLNKTARDKDTKMLPAYGPFAAILSYIIGKRKKNSKGESMKLYRGVKLPNDKISEIETMH